MTLHDDDTLQRRRVGALTAAGVLPKGSEGVRRFRGACKGVLQRAFVNRRDETLKIWNPYCNAHCNTKATLNGWTSHLCGKSSVLRVDAPEHSTIWVIACVELAAATHAATLLAGSGSQSINMRGADDRVRS